jgi:DNA repair protein RadA/Sms
MTKPRTRTIYVCEDCGADTLRWAGRCPTCGKWNTLVERTVEVGRDRSAFTSSVAPTRLAPQPLSEVTLDGFERIGLPLEEFGRVLGGGIVPGSLVLIGGDPGIGKSTLLLQVAALVAAQTSPILYVSGEESPQQVKLRAQRLGIDGEGVFLLSETKLDAILDHISQLQPRAVVVDSIQAVYLEGLSSTAGSVTQVRECAAQLLQVAKSENIPIFIVGHVTKTGVIAGPRVLEHMVDTVLYLEGERFHSYRLLRSVKNRFGSTNEVGVFEMGPEGMAEINNPSEAFLAERMTAVAGSAIAVTLEGTRPLLVEIQALTSTTNAALPRRTANGIDFNRLLILVAVLSKRVGLKLFNQDVFVNVVGGLRIVEPAADLAVAVAIASSVRGVPVAADLAIVGEIGLSGELRGETQIEKRLSEAAKLGFKRCLLPRLSKRTKLEIPNLELVGARSVGEALDVALGPPRTRPETKISDLGTS